MKYFIFIIFGIIIYFVLNYEEYFNIDNSIDCSNKTLAEGCNIETKTNCGQFCDTGKNEETCNNLKIFKDHNLYKCTWNASSCIASILNFNKCKPTLKYGLHIPVTSKENIQNTETSFINMDFNGFEKNFQIDTAGRYLIHPDYDSIKDTYEKYRRYPNQHPISSSDKYLYKEPWGGNSYLLSASNIKLTVSNHNDIIISDFKFYAYIRPTSGSHTTTNQFLIDNIGNFGFDYRKEYIDYNLFYHIPNVNFVELNLCNGNDGNEIVLYQDMPDNTNYKKYITMPNKFINFINASSSISIGDCVVPNIPFCIDSGGELPFINNPKDQDPSKRLNTKKLRENIGCNNKKCDIDTLPGGWDINNSDITCIKNNIKITFEGNQTYDYNDSLIIINESKKNYLDEFPYAFNSGYTFFKNNLVMYGKNNENNTNNIYLKKKNVYYK